MPKFNDSERQSLLELQAQREVTTADLLESAKSAIEAIALSSQTIQTAMQAAAQTVSQASAHAFAQLAQVANRQQRIDELNQRIDRVLQAHDGGA